MQAFREETLEEEDKMESFPQEIEREDAALRAVFTLLFFGIFSVLETVLSVIVVFQLLYTLISKQVPSPRVQEFANQLVAYFYQILRYVTHTQAEKPFPFSDFPLALEPPRDPYAAPELESELDALRED